MLRRAPPLHQPAFSHLEWFLLILHHYHDASAPRAQMLRYSLPSLLQLRRSFHASLPLLWKPRDESKLIQWELFNRITDLLVHHRFSVVEELRFTYSDDLLDSVFHQLRLDPVACLGFFTLASRKRKFKPSIKSYCKLVHILARARMYSETRAYLNEMVSLYRNNHSAFVIWIEIGKVYQEYTFAPIIFDMLLKVYAEKRMLKHALHVFDNMPNLGRVPTLRSCNCLLSGLVQSSEPYKAIVVYDQMMRLGLLPDVFTCSIMVNAYCKDGKMGRAQEFLKQMDKAGFEINEVTFHCLLNGYVSSGDMEGASQVLKVMEEKKIKVNSLTYTLLVKGYCKKLKMEDAEKVLQAMEEEGIAEEHAYGVLINAYCNAGKMDDGLRIQDKMLKFGLQMNHFICNSLINGYCKLGQLPKAEEMLAKMVQDWKLKPDSYTFNTLIDGLCRGQSMEDAFRVCDDMTRAGIRPSIITYNALLKGLCREKAFDDALKFWRRVLKSGVVPNEVTFGTLLDVSLKMGNVELAFQLWKQILARGFAKSTIVFNTMIHGLCALGKMVEAEEIYNRMEELGCMPDRITYGALHDGYCKAGNFERALNFSDKCGFVEQSRRLAQV